MMESVRRSGSVWAGLVMAALVSGCSPGTPASEGAQDGPPSHPATASSSSGMVVTGSPYATEAGVRVLEAGGNAVDAAVAAAFALAVAEPTQSGLGGRTQMLIRTAEGNAYGIDGTTQVPAGYDPETAPTGEHGHGAVGIPGTVAALGRAMEAHGTLSLGDVIEPALGFARDGIHLPEGEADRLAGVASAVDPGSELARIFYGPGGTPLEAGALLLQPELAGVLETLATHGADAFYTGEPARLMAGDMEAHGGFVTAQDLAAYQAVDAPVGWGKFAGARVLGSYLPASGVTVVEVLQILDRLETGDPAGGLWAASVVEALLAGFEDREVAEATLSPADAVAWLTSDSLADRRAGAIADKLRQFARAAEGDGPAGPGHPGGALDALAGVPAQAFDDGSEPAFTTHISVADSLGNVVALTQSLGPTLGARVVTPGLGFIYASTLGGYLTGGGPGYRPWSSQAPLVVVRNDGPVLVLGGAGARRILSALVTTLTRVLRDGESLEAAMAGPRLHPTGSRVDVQEGWGAQALLADFGYRVALRESAYFARLNAVELSDSGSYRGVGEPRWKESAAGGPRR